MSAEAYRDEEIYREAEPNVISIKRNPYLVDYEQQRRRREHRECGMSQGQTGRGERRAPRRAPQRMQEDNWEQEAGSMSRRTSQRAQEIRQGQETGREPRRMSQQGQETGRAPRRMSQQGQETGRASRRMSQREQEIQRRQEVRRDPQRASRMEASRRSVEPYPDSTLSQTQGKRTVVEKKRAAARRRQIVRMQRMVLFTGVFCIALLCGILYMKQIDVKAEAPDDKMSQQNIVDDTLPVVSTTGLIQGLPAAEFAKHPEWEENFLTPNEYSRPGDALEEVNSIFVHYTANPNTSAAQNRSYFEQLKDTHITSASAHFIIGYNGEVVQCIPLDEIAYAVQTRNFDSVSIECCYKSADGSFTQETYDSLIELLAWLTDAYDLTTDDILRHYDCGGKKCPIYYTEHEDAWAKLKKDVGEKL